MSEFSLIKQHFLSIGKDRNDVVLGIGDDAAIVGVGKKKNLAVSVDTFIENIHFPKQTRPYDIGWKSLAVNLSDMAAMGAEPMWATLAITLPENSDAWLVEFSRGFDDLAQQYDVALIGGDTTCGALSVTVNIIGNIVDGLELVRSAAKIGDKIYISGYLGDAALGLQSLSKQLPLSATEQQSLQRELNRPEPRVKEALALRSHINASIDISDGLFADLQHILLASGVGAVINLNHLPLSRAYHWCCNGKHSYDVALTGGDDYELCVTVSAENEKQFLECAEQFDTRWSCIGTISAQPGLSLLTANNEAYYVKQKAYNHFDKK